MKIDETVLDQLFELQQKRAETIDSTGEIAELVHSEHTFKCIDDPKTKTLRTMPHEKLHTGLWISTKSGTKIIVSTSAKAGENVAEYVEVKGKLHIMQPKNGAYVTGASVPIVGKSEAGDIAILASASLPVGTVISYYDSLMTVTGRRHQKHLCYLSLEPIQEPPKLTPKYVQPPTLRGEVTTTGPAHLRNHFYSQGR